MKTHLSETHQNTTRTAANDTAKGQRPTSADTLHFVDNRGLAKSQKSQEELIAKSPRAKQFKLFHEAVGHGGQLQQEAAYESGGAGDFTHQNDSAHRAGLPGQLKSSAEKLSGFSMDDVHVHYHSSKPGRLMALAYTQGPDIYLGPGQERHLPHEAWHVVQQKQGRVTPTRCLAKSIAINDDESLEHEADAMAGVMQNRSSSNDVLSDEMAPSIHEFAFGQNNKDFMPGGNDPISACEKSSPLTAMPLHASTDAPIQGVFLKVKDLLNVWQDQDTGDLYTLVYSNNIFFVLRRKDGLTLIVSTQNWEPIHENEVQKAVRLNKLPYGDYGNPKAEMEFDPEQESQPHFAQGTPSVPYAPEQAKQHSDPLLNHQHMTSAFTANVAVVPTQQGSSFSYEPLLPNWSSGFGPAITEEKFTPEQLWVDSTSVGDHDRPDTRYGDLQERHTVAWALLRKTHSAQASMKLSEMVDFYIEEIVSFSKIAQGVSADEYIKKVLTPFMGVNWKKAMLPIDRWQAIASELVEAYTQAYQLSAGATFKFGKAKGRNEGRHIAKLSMNEGALKATNKLKDKKGDVVKAAHGLLDVGFYASLGAEGVAAAVDHWIKALATAFPRIMKLLGEEITKPILQKPTPKTVKQDYDESNISGLLGHFDYNHGDMDFKALEPPQDFLQQSGMEGFKSVASNNNNSSFVSNVELVPSTTGQQNLFSFQFSNQPSDSFQIAHYKAGQLTIRAVNISDFDRPHTKFGSKQRSHTVAWTLLRHELMSFGAKRLLLSQLLDFLKAQFALLDGDIKAHHQQEKQIVADSLKQLENIDTAQQPMHVWQNWVADLIRRYMIAHQVSESATYYDEVAQGAFGHGEAAHMEVLRKTEYELKEASKVSASKERVIQAALALLDVQLSKTLNEKQIANAVRHWKHALNQIFPAIMKTIGAEIFTTAAKMGVGPNSALTLGVLVNNQIPGLL